MSDILIKGMGMPKGCAGCPIDSDSCELWTQLPITSLSNTRHEDCPLIPVPTHGRLIDADALIAAHEQVCSRSMKFNLDLAPTIIPAEEGE